MILQAALTDPIVLMYRADLDDARRVIGAAKLAARQEILFSPRWKKAGPEKWLAPTDPLKPIFALLGKYNERLSEINREDEMRGLKRPFVAPAKCA